MVHFGHSGCSLESCAKREGAGFARFPLMFTRLGSRRCAYRWTRPLGGGWRGYSLRDPWGVHWFAEKCAHFLQGSGSDPINVVPYMLASPGQPSLHGYDACMVLWVKGAFWINSRQNLRKTSFSHFRVFLCSRNSSFWWSGAPVWHLWIGRARHPGPDTVSFVVEVSNGGGLAHAWGFGLGYGGRFSGCSGASVHSY